MLDGFLDLRDDDLFRGDAFRFDAFHFDTGEGEQVIDFLDGFAREIEVGGEPVEGNVHGKESERRGWIAKRGAMEVSSLVSCVSRLVSSSELLEEADVVFDEQADVLDAPADHREAVEAHAEGEAGDLFGVEGVVLAGCADGLEDGGIDHAAAGDFDPTRGLALDG